MLAVAQSPTEERKSPALESPIGTGSFLVLDKNQLVITEKLGEGTSARVYKGTGRTEMLSLTRQGAYGDRVVAVKVFKHLESAKELDDFKKELTLQSKIKSPTVVNFIGVCYEPKFVGRSLYHVMMDEKEPFLMERTLHMAYQCVVGLNTLHSWSPTVLHRDLKSLNFLVDESDTVKICDFGLSREETDSNKSTLAKMRGTFAYTAPELYVGGGYSTKADVYSMSIVLWELMVRLCKGVYERPYAEYKNLTAGFQVIMKVARQNLRPTIPPNAPTELVELITKCWAPTPEERLDAASLLKTLQSMLEAEKAKKSPASPPRKQRPALQKTQGMRNIKAVFTVDELEELKGFNVR